MRIQATFVVCLLASTSLSTVAFAQPAEPEAAAPDKVEKVVVTAQRRSQQAQDVGIALTPVTGDTLRDRGITVVNGLENITPNLEVESQFGSGQPSFTIRGVGFRDYATNNSSTVGVYVDEVAYPLPVMTQGVLFDVDRVEVLRGPQGTLYGRNTTGGAINFISRKPTPETSAGFNAEYGRFDEFRAEGYVNGALGEGVNARLSATAQQGGAWQINRETGEDLGDADRFAGRGLIDFALTDNFDLLLNVHGYSDQSDGLGPQLFRDFIEPAHPNQRSTSWGASTGFAAANGITVDEKPFRDNTGFGASATARVDLSDVQLTYIGAYEQLDRREYNDYDALTLGGAGVLFDSDISVHSHEVRLASEDTGPFNWIAGAYYANESLDEVYNSDFDFFFADFFAGVFGVPVGTPFFVRTTYGQDVETFAVFGQADYRIAEQLKLVFGLRYEDEDRQLDDLATTIPYTLLNLATCSNFTNPATCSTALLDRSLATNEWSGKVALEFTPTDNLLYYASVSRGIKSGGFTAYNTLAPQGADPFEPEELWAYELGFKTDFADDTVRLNGAVFYYDYTNQQVQSAIAPGGIVIGRIVNAPESEIYGGELELIWRAAPELTITQSLGYKHGEFKEFQDLNTATLGTIDRSGQDIGFPELSYAGAFIYERATPLGFAYQAAIDYSYRDEQSFPLLGPDYTLDSYWLVNANVAIRPDGTNWEFALWGRNIFDQEYDEQRNFFVANGVTPLAFPGRPATYGVRIAANF